MSRMGSHRKMSAHVLNQLGGGWAFGLCDCGCRPKFDVLPAAQEAAAKDPTLLIDATARSALIWLTLIGYSMALLATWAAIWKAAWR